MNKFLLPSMAIFSLSIFCQPPCFGLDQPGTNAANPRPKYISVEAKAKPADSNWVSYETRTMEQLYDFKPDPKSIKLCEYGGRTDEKLKAKGFFYPLKIKDRWWLVDPHGHPFIHVAVVGVYTGITELDRKTSLEVFSSVEKWADFSTKLLSDHSFNGSGGWSEAQPLRKSHKPLVYTLSWDFMADFATNKGLAWQVSGHKGFPDEVWPVFHPEFVKFCEEYAKKLTATKNDPYCLGHFSDNELQTRLDMLDRTFKLDLTKYPEMKYNVEEARRWLSERKGKPAGLEDCTDKDRSDFIGYMFDTYFRLTTTAIRKQDPNHLCLGSRFNGVALRSKDAFRAAGKYLDVISANYYRAWTPDPQLMRMWYDESGSKPFIITEWYAKGMDSGLANTSGAGWCVKTQTDRGRFYQNFILGLMESKNCVGWHWFKYVDNNPNAVAPDPSNADSNKGIVNYKYEPYYPLLNEMKKFNENTYQLINYFDAK
jgi:hypothetical protein